VSGGGWEERRKRTSLVFGVEVDVAAHDLVKEGLGSVGRGPGSLEGVGNDIPGRRRCRAVVRERVRVAGHGENGVCSCLADLDHEENGRAPAA